MSRFCILSLCLVWAALSSHVFALSEIACRPCRSSDGPQCTHPGNANRMWCVSRCPNGVNSDTCVASHCFCAGSEVQPRLCSPCQVNDTNNDKCTHPGVANHAWCDLRCTKGVNTATCPASHCTCVPQQVNETKAKMQAQEKRAVQTLATVGDAKSLPSTKTVAQKPRDAFLSYITLAGVGFVIVVAAAFYATARFLRGQGTVVVHPGYARVTNEEAQPITRNVTRFPILV